MTVRFARGAGEEFQEAVKFYEARATGLGVRFDAQARWTVAQILMNPTRWTVIGQDVRRCLVPGFPCGILYSIEPDHVLILAVMHCRAGSRVIGNAGSENDAYGTATGRSLVTTP